MVAALKAQPADALLIDLSPIAADVAAAFRTIHALAPSAQLVVMTGQADALPAKVSTGVA